MNKDIRLSIGFMDHPKTLKLERRLGFQGVKCLIRLWDFAAQNKPRGIFSGMDSEDLELAARWDGDEGVFVNTLIDLCWLHDSEEGLYLHDWEEHQGYVVHAEERSAKARAAANARYAKRNANSMPQASDELAGSTAPSPVPDPLPSPVPDPKPSITDERFDNFWEAYPRKVGKDAARKAWKKIREPSVTLELILSALEWQRECREWKKDNGQYIPNPSTYLNQGRWLDEKSRDIVNQEGVSEFLRGITYDT